MIEIVLIRFKDDNSKIKTLLVRSRERDRSFFSRKVYIQKKPGKKLISNAINLMSKYTGFSYLDDCQIKKFGGKILWRVEHEE